jgi:hypothetical protein
VSPFGDLSLGLAKTTRELHSAVVLRRLIFRLVPRVVFLVMPTTLAIFFASCSSSTDDASSGSSDASVATDAATSIDAAPLCALATTPLIVDGVSGVPSRVHIQVTYRGASAVLLVDTGSNTTFLQEPLGSQDPLPDAGVLSIGCRTLDVIGRPEAADSPVNGLNSVGTFGTDMFLSGPTKLDFDASTISSHLSGSPFSEAATWPNAPFDLDKGLVLPHVSLDGTPVRLVLDTGSDHTLWLGQQPKAGDVEVDTTDAMGNPVKLYLGSVDLTIGSWQGTVPVLRAPSFPYLEQTVTDLGGNVAGLLGLSSLGAGFVIDGDFQVIRTNH